MNLTDEQRQIVDHKGKSTCKVTAYAGTGKTSTLVEFAKAHEEESLYAAFNKSVQLEAERKFPKHVLCRTVHALAYRHVHPKDVQGYVSYHEVAKLLGCSVSETLPIIETLEAFQNSAAFKLDADIVPFEFADLDETYRQERKERLAKAAKVVFDAMTDGRLKMTHAHYLKLYQLDKPDIDKERIYLDEAQDCNPVILDIVLRQSRWAKLTVMGDPYQQIYAFTGAIDAMERVKGDDFYLTQSWRFGPELAEHAGSFLGMFFDLPKPLRGNDAFATRVMRESALTFPYTFICRGNKTLFETAAFQASLGRKIALTGGQTFQAFLEDLMDMRKLAIGQGYNCRSPLYRALGKWDKLLAWAKEKDDAALSGKIEIIEKHGSRVPAMVQAIEDASVPGDMAQVLMLTAHRAKGLEWDRVVLGDDFPDFVNDDGELLAVGLDGKPGTIHPNEVNLFYVAMTRARKEIVLPRAYWTLMGEGVAA